MLIFVTHICNHDKASYGSCSLSHSLSLYPSWSCVKYRFVLVGSLNCIFVICEASGEPPLLLAVSVHCATRAAIKEARKQLSCWRGLDGCDLAFQLEVPATMPVVKELCGLDNVECYLKSLLST